MHELTIMKHVLEIAIDFGNEHDVKKITQINLVAGCLSNIIPKWADLFFQMIAKNTIAEGAKLSFDILPARILCRECKNETQFTTEKMLFHCSHCGSEEISLISGKEFQIKDMEVVVDT